MTELSEHDKMLVANGAAKALNIVCKMNNIDFSLLPENMRKAMLDSFIEGAKFVRDRL